MTPSAEAPGPERFPVVGIGASAGGLDALKKLFRGMPADSGLGFVVVQHLDPTHESLMTDLLSKQTVLPVVQITDGMEVAPNRVHIIPPNRYLTMAQGRLLLSALPRSRGMRMPIDHFFSSLAEEMNEYAICIVLSGTGSDGTLGLREIKGHGGMAVAQTIESAQYDGMPRSALATNMVDYLLPPDRMAEALVKYARHLLASGGREMRLSGADEANHLPELLAVLQSLTGQDFHFYKRGTLLRRIQRRMGLKSIVDFPDYLRFLHSHADESAQLAKDLLIGVTSFFRDPGAFEVLAKEVVPILLHSRGREGTIRVWVPGCSSGEEAYSLAMLLHERISVEGLHCGVQIFASDIDADALERARIGLYPESIASEVSPSRLQRFFTHEEDGYKINKILRDSVVFAFQNLISDPPFSKIDLISCRNLLIYLKQDVQKKLIRLFHFSLREPGFLFLGPSETVSLDGMFSAVSQHWRIFRRNSHELVPVDFPFVGGGGPSLDSGSLSLSPERPPDNLGELARKTLLEQYAPASVVINQNQDVLYFFGATTNYLHFPAGMPTRDLLSIVQEGLRSKLRGAIHKLLRNEDEMRIDVHARMRRSGHYELVQISVCHLKGAPGLLLVCFAPAVVSEAPNTIERAEGDNELVRQLEYELKITREDLQSSIEELETSNEELKASNEEAMSMNEELQSTNEELETSKEELQSLNEELNTVNNQLQEKVQELESINNDLANLLSSTEIATLFLDSSFRIKRFTPSATTLFNLIPSDLGRPITDIVQKFHGGDLVSAVSEVLRTLQPLSEEVKGENDRWYIRRILPYRTVDDRIDGVVVTFSDIRDLKLTMHELQESEERFRALFQKSPICLSEQDWSLVKKRLGGLTADHRDLEVYLEKHPEVIRKCLESIRVTKVNEATQRLFRAEHEEKLLADPMFFYSEQHLGGYAKLLGALARNESGYADDEVIQPLSGPPIPVYLSLLVLPGHEDRLDRILVTLLDISGRKEMEKVLLEREQRLRAILDNAVDAFITVDDKSSIQGFNHAAEHMFGMELEQARGSDIHALIPAAADEDDYFAAFKQRQSPRRPSLNLELNGSRHDGGLFPVEVTISEIDHLGLYLLLVRDLSDRKRLEREVIDASTLEQERIGRELHDDLGQQLTALDLLSTSLRDKLDKAGSPETAMAADLKNNLQGALTKVRAIARGLAPVEIDPSGLGTALEQLAESCCGGAGGVSCRFRASKAVDVSDGRIATHLFRIGQEAVNNAIKHAHAHNIELSLEQKNKRIFLCVSDDGVGLKAGDPDKQGLGMRIMRYRAHLIGARLKVSSTTDKGTRVCCAYPIDQEPK